MSDGPRYIRVAIDAQLELRRHINEALRRQHLNDRLEPEDE